MTKTHIPSGALSDEHVRAVLDSVPVAVTVLGGDGSTLYRNRAAAGLHDDGMGLADLPLHRAQGGERMQFDTTAARPGAAAVPVEVWMAPVHGATEGAAAAPLGTPDVAVVVVDIEERRRTERLLVEAHAELARKAAALERSNAELETFAYVASHDLSEPLRIISGYVELLARRYRGQLDSDADEFIDFATDGCVRMRRLIDDLLTYARVAWQQPERALVACDELATAALLRLHSHIEDARATVEVGPLPVLRGDGERLTAVFQNLVSNAVKFVRPDVPVRVTISAERTAVPGEWLFSVTDNGIGVEPAFRERAFGMFRRLHPRDSYPGTGIGLAMCRRIVEWHDGRIWIEDGPDGPDSGTTVRFTLVDGEDW